MTTDHTGAVVARYDYQPFGEEWPSPTTGESRKFTGTERDAETGFDYLGARYYQSQIGRLTSVDPGHVGADPANPQSWNGYAYALNNPLRFVDPLGMEPCQITLTGADASAAGVADGGSVEGECVRARETWTTWLSRNFFGLLDAVTFATPLQAPAFGQADQAVVDRSPDIPVLIAATIVRPSRAAAASRTTLGKMLQSEAGVAELLAGGGEVIAGVGHKTEIRDVARLLSQYGGTAAQWVKVSSTGPGVQVHAYRNIVTGMVVNLKSKIPSY